MENLRQKAQMQFIEKFGKSIAIEFVYEYFHVRSRARDANVVNIWF